MFFLFFRKFEASTVYPWKLTWNLKCLLRKGTSSSIHLRDWKGFQRWTNFRGCVLGPLPPPCNDGKAIYCLKWRSQCWPSLSTLTEKYHPPPKSNMTHLKMHVLLKSYWTYGFSNVMLVFRDVYIYICISTRSCYTCPPHWHLRCLWWTSGVISLDTS